MKTSYSTNLDLKSTDIGLLIFRIGIGSLILTHGFPKLLKFFGPEEITFGDPIGLGPTTTLALAVLAEFVCAIFLIFGFITRIASIPLICTMAVAALIVHMDDDFAIQEKSILFLVGFILLLFTGAGKYSIDYILLKRKK